MKSIRQLGWDFAHNHRAFAADVLGPLGILPLKWSEWYQDCLDIYWRLDVRDKVVLDIGSDFGTTPMFFLTQMGAKKVVGVSLESQYFSHMNYLKGKHSEGLYWSEPSMTALPGKCRDTHREMLAMCYPSVSTKHPDSMERGIARSGEIIDEFEPRSGYDAHAPFFIDERYCVRLHCSSPDKVYHLRKSAYVADIIIREYDSAGIAIVDHSFDARIHAL